MTNHRGDGGSLRLSPLDERPGPATRLSAHASQELVRTAMARRRARQESPRRRRPWLWAVAATMTLATSAGVAAMTTMWRADSELELHPAAPQAERSPPPPAPPEMSGIAADEPLPAEAAPLEGPPPSSAAGTASRLRRDHLAAANRLRGQRRWREAASAYDRIARQHARAPEAQAALVASGALRREQLGDPRGALVRLRRALALAPRGPLAEEALWGIADCYRQLGARGREAATLDQLVGSYPAGLRATKARERRAMLRPR